MISEISKDQINESITLGATLKIMSTNGDYALVFTENKPIFKVIATYEDSEYPTLVCLPKWKQPDPPPCKNC